MVDFRKEKNGGSHVFFFLSRGKAGGISEESTSLFIKNLYKEMFL